MAEIRKIGFHQGWGNDLHVLRGDKSTPLAKVVRLDLRDFGVISGDQVDPTKHGIELTFEPRFRHNAAPTDAVVNAWGVQVTRKTGVVEALTLQQAQGPRLIRNFLLHVYAGPPTGPAAPDTEAETWIRVHVHDDLQKLWLTPTSLTLRREEKGPQRITVLARFSDGVTGDISRWERLKWQVSPTAYRHVAQPQDPLDEVQLSMAGAPVTVGPQKVQIEVSLKPKPPATTVPPEWESSAEAIVRESWADVAAKTTLHFMKGKGEKSAPDVHNVLFLPDGFDDTDEDKEAFKRITDFIESRMRRRSKYEPFKLLRNSMNYWRAYVPSPKAGANVLAELWKEDDGSLKPAAYSVTEPTSAVEPSERSLWEMINVVGLPTAEDAGASHEDKVKAWAELYGGPQMSEADLRELTKGSFDLWRNNATRSVVNERDTAFRVVCGHRPSASTAGGYWPHRPARDVESFVKNLKVSLPPARTAIVILVREQGQAGLSTTGVDEFGVVRATLASERKYALKDAPEGGKQLNPDPLPPEWKPLDASYVVAHEVGHAFFLGDEYGGRGAPTEFVWERRGNVQTQEDVSPQPPVGPRTIDVTRIKWRWPRIKNAAVLRENTKIQSAPRRIPLEPGQAKRFAAKPRVHLRRRFPYLPDTPPNSGDLVIDSFQGDDVLVQTVPNLLDYERGAILRKSFTVFAFLVAKTTKQGNLLRVPLGPGEAIKFSTSDKVQLFPWWWEAPPESSAELEIDNVVGDDVLLKTSLTVDYPEGSILYEPVIENGVVREPITPLILQHFKDESAPLTAGPAPRPRGLQQPDALPKELAKRFRCYKPWIVGVYDGGKRYDSGLYHPTGVCAMRGPMEHDWNGKRLPRQRWWYYPFCPVCRYIIVDQADPTKHGKNDAVFHGRDPKP